MFSDFLGDATNPPLLYDDANSESLEVIHVSQTTPGSLLALQKTGLPNLFEQSFPVV